MSKKVLLLVLSLILAIGLIGCGGKTEAPKADAPKADAPKAEAPKADAPKADAGKKKIYLIVKVLGNQYYSIMQAGAEQAGKDLGVDVVIVGTAAESDIEGQLRYLQDAISSKAAGVVIAPLDSNALAKPVSEAFKSGIPVVLVDTKINSEDYSAAFLTDNVHAGRMAAEEMIKRMKAQGIKEDAEAQVAIQIASTGSQTITDRVKGFNEYWDANAPKAWVVLNKDIKVNEGDISKAVAFSQDFLTTYKNLKAVFGPNNGSTVGFVKGLMEAKRTDIVMVGFDFSPEIQAMIKTNEYNVASVVQRQYFMGYDGVKAALELSNGGTVKEKTVDTGVMLVDIKNMDTPEVQSIVKPGK